MANERLFRAPGFFEREIDASQRVQPAFGTPAGIIGTAEKGPAFVPVTVGSMPDFRARFGGLDSKRFGPYAVNEFLKHVKAVTYTRVLGAGALDTTANITTLRTQGTVQSAGFKVMSTTASLGVDMTNRNNGGVVFIAAKHTLQSGEAIGYPVFTDNDSHGASSVYLIRSMIMMASGTRMIVFDGDRTTVGASWWTSGDEAKLDASAGQTQNKFKIIISSSAPLYGSTNGQTGVRLYTVSLNPANSDYISKVLNTDPEKFIEHEHLLYADFPVENELATVPTNAGAIALLSGSGVTSSTSGDTTQTFNDLFGRFDTRFTTPSTTWFISQPYGLSEYNLFKFEALSDGAWANDKIKVSIVDLRKSTDPASDYGSFSVQIREFDDTDFDPKIIEQFPNCNLNPSSPNFIGRIIGDTKAFFMFDADRESDRRVTVTGRYPNKSSLVRVVVNDSVLNGTTPATALPFGFRGPPALKTSDMLGDVGQTVTTGTPARRLYAYTTGTFTDANVTGSVIPPLPFTYKVTQGTIYGANAEAVAFDGQPGAIEYVDPRIYWGVKTTRCPQTGSLGSAVFNANNSVVTNPLVKTYTKMLGIAKLDAVVTGSGADTFSNNKFTLARVALSNQTVAQVTGTANQHMLEASYFRSATPNSNTYNVTDAISSVSRVTLATLVNLTSSVEFNRFSAFAKFTNIFHGGFDGVNILDINSSRLNDRAASSDTGGGAATSYRSPGLLTNVNNSGTLNNAIASYRAATNIMTDELTVNTNILAIPGIRDSFVTDHAATRCKDNGLIMFVQDIVEYDDSGNRLFDSDSTKPDVKKTVDNFESRALNNNYAAAYFPDVVISDDDNNGRRIMVPPSVAVMGALAFNDKVGFPWFAPAGFTRAGLDFVSNVDVRLSRDDRDRLYDARINPITHFPRAGTSPTFVIFGQKTLQATKSALDRVNVRRMLLEVKRIVVQITREGFVFEQNTPATRTRWISLIVPRLATIQAQAGIEGFKVVMDGSNNTAADVESNKLNGRIVIVPTRSIEYIDVSFVITNAGVAFDE